MGSIFKILLTVTLFVGAFGENPESNNGMTFKRI